MIASIYKRHNRLDIVINNAGIASMNHFLLTPAETAKKIVSDVRISVSELKESESSARLPEKIPPRSFMIKRNVFSTMPNTVIFI